MEEKPFKVRRVSAEIWYEEASCPTSDDVAAQVEAALDNALTDADTVEVSAEPTNDDRKMPGVVEEVLHMIEVYASFLEGKGEENSSAELLAPGIDRIRHGITDLYATVRCLRFFSKRAAEAVGYVGGLQAMTITPENIHNVPTPILHTVAHDLAHQIGKEDCGFHETMEREELINWIVAHARNLGGGKPETPLMN